MDSFHEDLASAVTDWLEQHTGVGLRKPTADKLVADAILPLFAAKDAEIERWQSMWHDEYLLFNGNCGLCNNTAYATLHDGRKKPCICLNGRAALDRGEG